MRSVRAATLAVLVTVLPSGIAADDDIRVLSVGSVQIATKIIAAEFEKSSGHKVLFTIVSPDRIAGQLAKAPFDMLIASVPVIEALDKAGGIRAGTRAPLARAGIGVMVRDGAPVPDVATPDGFTKALLAARSIVHGDPALPNQSGVVTMRILAKAGVLDAVRPKARAAALADGLAMVAKGDVELALFNQVELPAGVHLAGPVPLPLQDYTFYEAALLAKGAAPGAAQRFIARMAGAAARKAWEAARLDAYPYR
jgi:molybdate transport system substrate-binding protein